MKTGWSETLKKDKYYSDSNGVVLTGTQKIDGVEYNFGTDGKLKTGFQTINGKKYYFYANGSKAKGVQKLEGSRHYFDFNTGELKKSGIKHIVDVSYAQGNIDWDALWKSGQIDGAIIRIGYGTSRVDDCVQDNYFERNLAAVRRLKIPYSVYIYGYAQTSYAATKEANFVVSKLKKYNMNDMSFPVYYDAEESYRNGISYTSSMYSMTINTFANILKSNGYKTGVYGSASKFISGFLNDPLIKQYPLWVAQYYSVCQYNGSYVGWQYTSSGRISGHNGNLDLSIFY